MLSGIRPLCYRWAWFIELAGPVRSMCERGYSASLAFCSATACMAAAPMKLTGWQKLGWKNRSTLAS